MTPPLACGHLGVTERPTVPRARDAFAWCDTCRGWRRIIHDWLTFMWW